MDGETLAISPRPFEQQTYLERTLRAELYHPRTFLAEAEDRIKKAAKAGNYEVAAALQKQRSTSKLEMAKWLHLLELYETEFRGEPSIRCSVCGHVDAIDVLKCDECGADMGDGSQPSLELDALALCHQIEKCGASPELTEASLMASRLRQRLSQEKTTAMDRLRKAMEKVRDTSLAMKDSLRCYPEGGTVILAEGPDRLHKLACEALYPENGQGQIPT